MDLQEAWVIVRVFRTLHWIHDLRMMVACVTGSIVSLLWVASFMLLMNLIASLIWMQALISLMPLDLASKSPTCAEPALGAGVTKEESLEAVVWVSEWLYVACW